MTWSINGTSLADLGVDSLGIHLRNQDDDYVELRFPSNFDAELPSWLQQDSYVDVRYNGSVVFRGYADGKTVFASPSMEYKSLFLFGPWHLLNRNMFFYNYPYLFGNITTTHGVIGGSANSLVSSILLQASAYLAIGTIDLGDITIPTTDVYDMTLAQALQTVLRFIPGALVLFDYETGNPTCHVLADNSSSLQTVNINVVHGSCMSFQMKPRYDRYISGAQIYYEAGKTMKYGENYACQDGYGQSSNTISSPVTTATGFYIVAVDAAGGGTRMLHRTIRLSGALEITQYSLRGRTYQSTSLGNMSIPSSAGGQTGVPQFQTFGWFMRLFSTQRDWRLPSSGFNYLYEWYKVGQMSISNVNYLSGNSSINYMYPVLLNGQNLNTPSPFTLNPIVPLGYSVAMPAGSVQDVFLTGSPYIRACTASIKWQQIYSEFTGGYLDLEANNVLFFDSRDVSGEFTFTKTVTNSTVEPTPSGIAQKILAANSRLLHDGSLTLAEANPATFFGRKRRIAISPMGVSTPVQSVDIDSATNRVGLSFGAPNHLGPQDLITLLRAGTHA